MRNAWHAHRPTAPAQRPTNGPMLNRDHHSLLPHRLIEPRPSMAAAIPWAPPVRQTRSLTLVPRMRRQFGCVPDAPPSAANVPPEVGLPTAEHYVATLLSTIVEKVTDVHGYNWHFIARSTARPTHGSPTDISVNANDHVQLSPQQARRVGTQPWGDASRPPPLHHVTGNRPPQVLVPFSRPKSERTPENSRSITAWTCPVQAADATSPAIQRCAEDRQKRATARRPCRPRGNARSTAALDTTQRETQNATRSAIVTHLRPTPAVASSPTKNGRRCKHLRPCSSCQGKSICPSSAVHRWPYGMMM